MIHDVRAIRDAQCFPDAMIGDQHADSGAAKIADNLLKILHGQRVDPGKRLVEQNERGLQGQRAGDFQPAALSARERVGLACAGRFPGPSAPATLPDGPAAAPA